MTSKITNATAYAWVILAAVYLASIAAPLHQYKAPPIMPVLMNQFQISLTQAGFLMSSIAFTGLLLAFPAGFILQRLGAKVSGLIALGCMAGGAILGAASQNFPLLAASRVIEGIGAGLIGVIAPATIAQWFPPRQQGAAMGIWATWAPVGSIVMFNTAPALAENLGWRAVWWFGAGYTLLAALFYMLFIRQPPLQENQPVRQNPFAQAKDAFSSPSIWLLAASFACFNLVLVSFATYYPTFLHQELAYPLEKAAFYSSIATIVILFSAPFAGWLSDRIGSRHLFLALPFLAIAILFFFPFRVSGWQIIVLMTLQGLLVGAIPTATFAATSEVMEKPEWAGLGLALILIGQNLGQLIGPVIFGEAVRMSGWVFAGYTMIPFALIGFLCAWKLRIR
ncbi:MAG: MFS transporter [Chloroflexota bacterium]